MQQSILNAEISAHREHQACIWAPQLRTTLDQSHASGTKAYERPRGGTLLGSPALPAARSYRQLAIEIVSNNGRERRHLVVSTPSAGDAIHLCLGLKLCEDHRLSAATVVQRHELARRYHDIAHDRLELIAILIQCGRLHLERIFALRGFAGLDKQEAPRLLPSARLPVALEGTHLIISTAPVAALLVPRLQLPEAGEGHRGGVLGSERLERPVGLIGEERAVHAPLEDHAEQDLADVPEAEEDEGASAVGVVGIGRVVPDIEYLAGLYHRVKESIAASLALLLPTVSDRDVLDRAHGTAHLAIDDQRQTCRAARLQPLKHQRTGKTTQFSHRRLIYSQECTADRCDIRKALQARRPTRHRVILLVTQVQEQRGANHQMHDQQHYSQGVSADRVDLEMIDAAAQSQRECLPIEQRLKDYQHGKESQPPILEMDPRQCAGLPMDLGIAKFMQTAVSLTRLLRGNTVIAELIRLFVLKRQNFTSSTLIIVESSKIPAPVRSACDHRLLSPGNLRILQLVS